MLTGTCHCGATGWRFKDDPATVTGCNCTLCRRSAALWAYGSAEDTVILEGDTRIYTRADHGKLAMHHCLACANTLGWYALAPNDNGTRSAAVNLRLIDDPMPVFDLPVRHFDGLQRFASLGHDTRTVRDMWF